MSNYESELQEYYDALYATNEDDFLIHLDPAEYANPTADPGPYRHAYIRRRP